ncbi:M13-type metalloendopeptidase [Escherichia coli]
MAYHLLMVLLMVSLLFQKISQMRAPKLCFRSSKTEADHSLADFSSAGRRFWRTKAKKEYQQLLLQIDVHAPAKLRANIQPQNLMEFYDTFAITEKDAMYLPPEKRVHIW